MTQLNEHLERHQISIYLTAVGLAGIGAVLLPSTHRLEAAITPALALMLFATFLQVPLVELGRAFSQPRFLVVLLLANFLFVPLLLAALFPLFPANPLIQLGVLLVLLAPCIDYVVSFSHIGRADARLLLASTPLLLIAQILLLPLYLRFFLGQAAEGLVQPEPFLQAFFWLIAVPLIAAFLLQRWSAHSVNRITIIDKLSLLPVPTTALVLCIVVMAVTPQLAAARDAAWHVLPIYVVFAVIAPVMGWCVARFAGLDAPSARAVTFSTATRNSLVILPLVLAIPDSMPVLPAVVVTQTLVELLSSLIYMRVLPRLGKG